MFYDRLSSYVENKKTFVLKNQAGFRQSHSTLDNVLILHLLYEYCKHKKSKLLYAFVDFTKAFDTV